MEAEEGASVTASCASSETATLTGGQWVKLQTAKLVYFSTTYTGSLETGAYNTLTITVTADGQSQNYTVTIPMQPDISKAKLSWKTNLPEEVYCNPGSQGKTLTVQAQYENRPLDDDSAITYQWYAADGADEEGTALEGQTGESYTAPTGSTGVKYYYVLATCGKKTLKSQVTGLHVTQDAAPTSITVVCDYAHTVPDSWSMALGGVDYVAKVGDKLTLRALDQDGKETPVQWPTSLGGNSLDVTTGTTAVYTIANTNNTYIQVSSLFDSTVKSEEKALVVKNYTFSSYYKAPSATLSTDGQKVTTISTNGGLNGYVLWKYEMTPENAASLTSDLGKKSNILTFQALRPGTITATFDLDLDGDGKGDGLTDTATLTIKGLSVEDTSGNLGRTRLETSTDAAHPTMQLKALSYKDNATFTWSSGDETIATVDENGLVTAQGIGSTIITAKDGTYTGGIKVVVTSATVPYFEALDFTTTNNWNIGLSNTSWRPTYFKATTLNYTGLTLTQASASSLTFSESTLYDTEKWVATAAYTDETGASQEVPIASGAATTLKNLSMETSTVTVTLASRVDASVKTVYTFEITRPRDKTKTIANQGIVFAPEGREIWKEQYDSRTEGIMYVANAGGSFAQYQGVTYSRSYYRVYAMDALEAFTLTIKGSTAYTHLRYSLDDGQTWIYLGQTGADGMKTQPISFPARVDGDTNPVVKVTIQVLDDATYTGNTKAGKDGFADASPSSYYVWLEQIGRISAECDIVTAQTPYGDWYPAFAPEHTDYRLITGVGTNPPVLTFTVSEDATVYVADTLQTPDESGNYTLALTGETQSVVVKASNAMTEKTYTFGSSSRLSELYPDKVVDYLPVNSQYANGGSGYGINPQQTLTGGLLSLGNFGGYVTFYYEQGLTDDPSHPYGVDFYVDGNAFVDTSTGTGLGSMEPGQVWVSEDGSTWYALAGSEHYEDSTLWNYAVTYSKTETGGISWADNYGNTSATTHGRAFEWPDASIYTMNDLASLNSFTLTGVLLPCVDGTIAGTDTFNSFSKGARFGYVDTMVNGTSNPYGYNADYKNASSGFDLAWAVDENGDPVDVSGKSFHYVKVVTASNLMAGLANEKSTEVASVSRVPSAAEAVGVTNAPTGVTFTSGDNSFVLDFEDGEQIYEVELPGMDNVSVLLNGTAEDDNIYINNQRVASGTAATGFAITDTTQRLIRIIVQNGEKEPVIYLLKVKNETQYTYQSFQLYRSLAAYESGESPLTISPEFDGSIRTGYTVKVPDYADTLYAVGEITPAVEDETYVFVYSRYSWNTWTSALTKNSRIATNIGIKSGCIQSKFYGEKDADAYTFNVSRYATLTGLQADGIINQPFDPNTNTYHVYIEGDAETFTLTPTAYSATYTILVNGTAVTSGTEVQLPCQWNDQGTMDVEIVLEGTNVTAGIYTLHVSKKPQESKPFVMQQETAEADYTVIDEASYLKDLYVVASASGEMIYQWYYTTDGTTKNGTLVEGATESSFVPVITEDAIGTRYYYCQITNTGATEDNVACSQPVRVTVDPDPTPVAVFTSLGNPMPDDGYDYAWDVGYFYNLGDEAVPVSLKVTTAVEGGTLSYSWGYGSQGWNMGSWSLVLGATGNSVSPKTDASVANTTGNFYHCQVTNTFKGRKYTAWASTGQTYTDPETEKAYDVRGVYVFVKVTEAAMPSFQTQPQSAYYMVGDAMSNLNVYARKDDNGTMTYQWFVNDVESTEGATALGAPQLLNNSYKLGTAAQAGTKYYFCVATNTNQGYVATATSDIATITINDTNSLVAGRLQGSGTKEDPYHIATAEDYQLVAELVAEKCSFNGTYLLQTADITLPEDWTGIGCRINPNISHINRGKNMAAFSGTLDGGGHTLTIPEGGLPLFSYVRGATVKNLNIFGKRIAGYGLVNNLEGVGLSGEAICIDHVTLKSGSATQKAGFIGTYITNNGFAGCSAAFYVTIKNSTIEKDVIIGYDADQKMIGSFAGRVHGTIENCVSYATVKGTNYVGGILGTRDNAMGNCTVNNCQFYGTVEASGQHAGGIVGGGYENSTAPNGNIPNVTNCTVNATITDKDKVGGILGGDSYVAQSWGGWSLTGNTFIGSLTATEGTYAGGIVGYLLSMNKYAGISDNYYVTNSVNRAIGFVKYLDTSFENPVAFEDTIVFDTSKGTALCPTVTGCNWREDLNRTDDPLNEQTTVTGQATVIASFSGDTQLLSGKSTTLKALDENGKAISAATWALDEESKEYATVTVKQGVATVKALEVSETHQVTLTAQAPGGAARSITLTIVPKAQGIVLSQKDVTVDIGGEYTSPVFTATVLPADAAQSVTWTSSNKKIATVEDGKLTLTGALGSVKITATTTDGTKLSASVTVNVVKLAQSIVLSGTDSILGGKSASYTATEENGTAIKATDIAWSLSDTTYASVNAFGKLTTKAVPETVELTLTATVKNSERYAAKTITLTPAATYVDILMGDEAASVVTGSAHTCNIRDNATSLTLHAAVYPAGAAEAVTWKSSNTKVATVENGIVTYAGKTGTATITATAADGTGKNATVKITFAQLATKVEIQEHAQTLRSGEKLTLKATTDLEKTGVTWALANPGDKNYVTLSGNGTLKAKTVYESHSVTLYAFAKDGGAVAETTLTIQPASDQVLVLTHLGENVTKTTQSVNRSAGTYALTAANVAGQEQQVQWKTSNKRIVSLSTTEGSQVTLNLLKAGTATVTATAADGSKTTVTIKVTTLVESLAITGSDTIASGKSITLKAVAAPSTAANKAVTWALAEGDEAYASISASGKLTAAKKQMSAKTITVLASARDGSGATARKQITIQPVATSILVEQKAQSVDIRETKTLQLSAKVYPGAANQSVKWSSSNAKIASVDDTGCVSFHKGGVVTIIATTTDGTNKKSTVKFTAVKSVESIALEDTLLAGGKSLNLAKLVTVDPGDATNKKLSWSITGDTAYATLSSSGTLKAKAVSQMKTVQVTATAADGYGAKATATIHIYPATTKVAIQLDGQTVTGTLKLPQGESMQLNALSLPMDAYQDWTWSTNNKAAASVDESGCVTGLQSGKTVTITAAATDGTGKKATIKVQIIPD